MKRTLGIILGAVMFITPLIDGCASSEPNDLDKLKTVRLAIKGAPFEVWIADTAETQERGLMKVTAGQMADLPDGTHRGMLFVFEDERYHSFWMKDTIIPLDIAYMTSEGIVTATHTMTPLDVRPNQYPSLRPARFALEVNANLFTELGLRKGDRIEIPESVLKTSR
jgi:uncharacterized membrane protein (UPF0127 family)